MSGYLCYNEVIFYTEKENISLLQDLQMSFGEIETGFLSLKDYIKETLEKTIKGEDIYNFRSVIDYYRKLMDKSNNTGTIGAVDENIILRRDGICYFGIGVTSEWEPQLEGLLRCIEYTYLKKIKMVFRSIETGSGLFFTNDKQKLFFKENYYVENPHEGKFFFFSFDEAKNYLKQAFPYSGIDDKDTNIIHLMEKLKNVDEDVTIGKIGVWDNHKF